MKLLGCVLVLLLACSANAGGLRGNSAEHGNPHRQLWSIGKTCMKSEFNYAEAHVKYDGIVHARCECTSDSSWVHSNCPWPSGVGVPWAYPDSDYLKNFVTCGNPEVIPNKLELITDRTNRISNNEWIEITYAQTPEKWLECPNHDVCKPPLTSTNNVIENYPAYDPHHDFKEVLNKVNTVLDVGSFLSAACLAGTGGEGAPGIGCTAVQNGISAAKTFTDPLTGVFGFLFPKQQATQLEDLCAHEGLEGPDITTEQFERCIWNTVGSLSNQLIDEKITKSRIRDLQSKNTNLLAHVIDVESALAVAHNITNSEERNMEYDRIANWLGTVVRPLSGATDDFFSIDKFPGSAGVEETVELANRAEIEIRAAEQLYTMDCKHQTDQAFNDVTETIQEYITELERRVPILKARRMKKIGEVERVDGSLLDASASKVERLTFKDNPNGKCPYSFDFGNGYHNTVGVSAHISCGSPRYGGLIGKQTGPVWEFATKCRNDHITAIKQQQDAFWGLYVGKPSSKAEQWKQTLASWKDNKAVAMQFCCDRKKMECENGGTTIVIEEKCRCKCATGYSGDRCETEIDATAPEWLETVEGFTDLRKHNERVTLKKCKSLCAAAPACHGVSRRRAAAPTATATCWLESANPNRADRPGTGYRTLLKPASGAVTTLLKPVATAPGASVGYARHESANPNRADRPETTLLKPASGAVTTLLKPVATAPGASVGYARLMAGCGSDTAFLANPIGETLGSCQSLCTNTDTCDSVGFNAGTGNCVLRNNMFCNAAAGWVYYKQEQSTDVDCGAGECAGADDGGASAPEWLESLEGFTDLRKHNERVTLKKCKSLCAAAPACHGVSRRRAAAPTAKATCWLESASPNPADRPGTGYITLLKPASGAVKAPTCPVARTCRCGGNCGHCGYGCSGGPSSNSCQACREWKKSHGLSPSGSGASWSDWVRNPSGLRLSLVSGYRGTRG